LATTRPTGGAGAALRALTGRERGGHASVSCQCVRFSRDRTPHAPRTRCCCRRRARTCDAAPRAALARGSAHRLPLPSSASSVLGAAATTPAFAPPAPPPPPARSSPRCSASASCGCRMRSGCIALKVAFSSAGASAARAGFPAGFCQARVVSAGPLCR
jgi:hypothetical protein